MANRPLASDETIKTVHQTLENPIEYVRQIYARMIVYAREFDGVSVSIGTTGEGKYPNYRIAFLSLENGGDANPDHHAYNGRSHKKTDWSAEEMQNTRWSSREMSIAEVKGLFEDIQSGRIIPTRG